jgi:hypothetical protein
MINRIFQNVPTVIYLYGGWVFIHYISGHLYTIYCTPLSVYGFIMSPFNATLPYCKALRWLNYNSGDNISNMWILIGAWFMQHIIYASTNSRK